MVQAPPQYANGQSLIRPGQYTDPPRLIDPKTNEPFADDGAMALPHVFNFAAIWNYFNQTYSYRYDEALKQSWENALCMRRDTFIWGCLEERYLGVIASPWSIKSIDKEADDAAKERAGELTELVQAIPRLMNFFWSLEDAAWYGRYGNQFAFGPTEVNGMPQRGIVRWVPVNGDKIQCEWDGVPAVMISPMKRSDYEKNGWTVKNGERAPLVYLDKPELRDRFAISQHWRDDADYFEGEMAGAVAGVGIRSRIYWSWWMRYEMLGWAVNYMRKVGTLGLLIFPYDEGNPDSEAAAKTNSRQAGNRSTLIMPVPRGADPKHLSPQIVAPNTAGIDALTGMIDSYWERHIERYIVGQNMSDGSDNDSGLGGSGRANFAAASQYLKIKCDADMLAETMTQDVVRVLHKMNYPGEPFRYRFTFDVDDPKSKERLEAAKSIVDMGGSVKADDVREVGGFSKPNPDDEVLGGQIAPAPFGKGLDGEPMKTPMGFGKGEPGGQAGDEQQPPEEYSFDPSQPRDEEGKWTAGISNLSGWVKPSAKSDLKGSSIRLWHGTSLKNAQNIIKQGLKEGPRGLNAAADVDSASQYPEDTGAEALILVSADPRDLGIDPEDQVGETVEEGLFPDRGNSSATVRKSNVLAVIDIKNAKNQDKALKALNNGNLEQAIKYGAKILFVKSDDDGEEKAVDEQYQRDAMNDRQFAAAMERLAKIEANMTEQRQQNYARSNDEAVTFLHQRINDMQRYDSQERFAQSEESHQSLIREMVSALREIKPPDVIVEASKPIVIPAPQVTVEAAKPVVVPSPQVTVEAAKVTVPTPQVTVEASKPQTITVAAPAVTVNVPEPPEMEITDIERGKDGLISRFIRKLTRK